MKDSHCRAGADDTGRYRVPAHDSLRKLGVKPLTHCPGCDPVRVPLPDPIFDEVQYPDEWPTPVNPLHAHMQETFAACLAISRRKNADYAGDADPLANFRICQQFGVALPQGIMVRLSDKFSRIGNLLDGHAPAVEDERLTDTIQDAINYLAILSYALTSEVTK